MNNDANEPELDEDEKGEKQEPEKNQKNRQEGEQNCKVDKRCARFPE